MVVVTVGSFSWGRWLRYDDAADFQGAWYANGTTSLVTVDGQEIHLTSDVAYGYTLDTGAKTITFTFGDLQGQGRYRFSADRSELVITDGDGSRSGATCSAISAGSSASSSPGCRARRSRVRKSSTA